MFAFLMFSEPALVEVALGTYSALKMTPFSGMSLQMSREIPLISQILIANGSFETTSFSGMGL
jgi:hypothetical protein